MSDTISYMLKTSSAQILGAMTGVLEKARQHAEEAGVEESVFLTARLYPDMFPMGRQVQVATGICGDGAARLADVSPLGLPDTETTFTELIARCEKTVAFVGELEDGALDAKADSTLNIPIGENTVPMLGRFYMSNFILPNLIFHAATAYGLLRHQGVQLGKRDFLLPGGVFPGG